MSRLRLGVSVAGLHCTWPSVNTSYHLRLVKFGQKNPQSLHVTQPGSLQNVLSRENLYLLASSFKREKETMYVIGP